MIRQALCRSVHSARPTPLLVRGLATTSTPHPSFHLSDPSILSSHGFISGHLTPAASGATYQVLDPGTARPWHRVAAMGLTETEQAIFAADAAFPAFAALPGRVRGRMIMEMDRLFVQAKRDLAQIAVLECGKSLAEAEGEVVVGCEREVDAEGQF